MHASAHPACRAEMKWADFVFAVQAAVFRRKGDRIEVKISGEGCTFDSGLCSMTPGDDNCGQNLLIC